MKRRSPQGLLRERAASLFFRIMKSRLTCVGGFVVSRLRKVSVGLGTVLSSQSRVARVRQLKPEEGLPAAKWL